MSKKEEKENKNSEEDIKKKITEEANLILKSIEFVGNELIKVIKKIDSLELEDADNEKTIKKFIELEKEVVGLSKKLDEEDKNIIEFFKKYKNYEKEDIVSNFAEIEQALNGCLSKDKTRKNCGGRIQKKSRKKS